MKKINFYQFGRYLLPISFFFRMVQMSRCFLTTCTKPLHEEKNIKQMCRYKKECGRSMVEMLGVLAIIGVLSVGAIAGYQKAMFKYKMNKTMDIISHAVHRVAELDNMKIGEEIYSAEAVKKYGIMPDCDVNYVNIQGQKGENCPLPLGEVWFDLDGNNSFLGGNIDITFTKQPFDSCVAFLSSGIYKNVPEDWWYPVCDDADECGSGGFIYVLPSSEFKYFYGKSEFVLSHGAKSNPTNQDILEACELCKNNDFCTISWSIRWEI